MIEVAGGELEAAVEGGAHLTIASLRHRGTELLAAPDGLPASYKVFGERTGVTFLHPWANRVGADRFASPAGREIDLAGAPVARDPNGIALHGYAVPGTWTPRASGDAEVVASASFDAVAAFPWAHEVEIVIALEAPARLVVTTTIRATGGEDVPVAFGWHPYFTLAAPRAEWRLALPARRRLEADDRGIPTGATVAEDAEEAPLGERTFDDGYDGVAEGAELAIADGDRRIVVGLHAGYPIAQVFAPGDAALVSLEPMTAPTDALRSGRGLDLVAERSTRFTVEVR